MNETDVTKGSRYGNRSNDYEDATLGTFVSAWGVWKDKEYGWLQGLVIWTGRKTIVIKTVNGRKYICGSRVIRVYGGWHPNLDFINRERKKLGLPAVDYWP